MAGNRYSPLSGDVTQAINPWTWFARIAGSQMGFINIHQSTSGDPELEREIVEDVASYGRQLGRITDALKVLAESADTSGLDARDREALASFKAMAEDIEQAKQRRRQSGSPLNDLDRVLGALEDLRETDPTRYQRELERVKTTLGLTETGERVSAIDAKRRQGNAE